MSDPDQIAVDDFMSILRRWSEDFQSQYNQETERQRRVQCCQSASLAAYEVVCVFEKAFKDALNEKDDSASPFSGTNHKKWFGQISNFLAKEGLAALDDSEVRSLKRGINEIQKTVAIRIEDVHRLCEDESTFQAIRKFPDSIQVILAILNSRRYSNKFVDLVFDHWNKEPAGLISWVRFWRTLDAIPREAQKDAELLKRLAKVRQIGADIRMNDADLSSIILLQRRKFPRQEIESVLYEIKSEIETCSPATILDLFKQPSFCTIFESAEKTSRKVLRVIRLKISEKGQGDGLRGPFLVDIGRAERGKPPVPFQGAQGVQCDNLTDVITLLAETLSADSDLDYRKWVIQLLVPPNLGHVVFQHEYVREFLQDLSVVVAAPRKGRSMDSRNHARLAHKKHHHVSSPDELNQFKDVVPGTREIQRKSSAEVGQVQLFAGQTAWDVESKCVWMNSFADLHFSMFVLCVNEDPQEDWNEVVGFADSTVDVSEFMERLGKKQNESDEGENHAPLVLWQDTQYEPKRSRSLG
jgi:hypothetical protein